MISERNISFGKYKGECIRKLILTHLGYIMWCLSNLNWFKLTDDEQRLYDLMAIAVINSDCETSYPKEELKKYVRDTFSLATKSTPFRVTQDGNVMCDSSTREKYDLNKFVNNKISKRSINHSDLYGLQHSAAKIGFGKFYYDYDYEEYLEDGLFNDFFY